MVRELPNAFLRKLPNSAGHTHELSIKQWESLASAPLCIGGLKPSFSRAANGRRIPTGMLNLNL